jgi:hypothetical protein
MRNSIKEAVSSTIKDMIKADLNVSFTQKELPIITILLCMD